MLLVINYHYVRDVDTSRSRGIHPTTPTQLRDQLANLLKEVRFIGLPELIDHLHSGQNLRDNRCLVTFDDGLREQAQLAVPVLDNLGIPAIFFVNTLPLTEGGALLVHKIHWLRECIPQDEFLTAFKAHASRLGLEELLRETNEKAAAAQYLYDDAATAQIKFLLNHVMPFDATEEIIGNMFSERMDEEAFSRDLYMSAQDICEIGRSHAIGSHSHAHRPLSSLSSRELEDDLGGSRKVLEQITNRPVLAVSYPYGGPTAVNRDVADTAGRVGYEVGFTMERCANRTLADPLLLGRVSTNDAPGGEQACVEVKNGRFSCTIPAEVRRTRYLVEQ